MTSNLANDEIADHALQLRREAEAITKQRSTKNNEGIFFLQYQTEVCI